MGDWRLVRMGRHLAFVRADSKKHPQVWVMSLTGPGEPRMVTDLENGATGPKWRHDSQALLVASAVPIAKLPGKPEFSLERPGRDWWDFDRNKKDEAEKGSPDGDLREIRDWLEHNSYITTRAILRGLVFWRSSG